MRTDLFDRPEGALMLSDIKEGLVCYHVYGYPGAKGNIDICKILSQPAKYKDTDDYKNHFLKKKSKASKSKVDDRLNNSIVFQIEETHNSFFDGKPITQKRLAYASDNSLLEERHNNNFLFVDIWFAQKYADFIKTHYWDYIPSPDPC